MKDRRLYLVWCENKKEWEKNRTALLPNGALFDLDNGKVLLEENHIIEFSFTFTLLPPSR